MREGVQKMEVGAGQAAQAGIALDNILQATEAVNQQVIGIAATAQRMQGSSSELVSAMTSVNEVVETNIGAAEQMAVESNEVTQAVENIASVSEENSAAVEEVSASAEEMSAQMQEVTFSAQTLSEMAQRLQEIVAKFRLPDKETYPSTPRSMVVSVAAKVMKGQIRQFQP
jgi:methyl-accepting chemotaxis protein